MRSSYSSIFTAARLIAFTKTVRVGWYESPLKQTDEFGRRSGYAYEYQQKIVAYIGWNYEYVEGSWSELLQMPIDSEINLMSDISHIDECAGLMPLRFVRIRLKDGTEEVVENTIPKVNGIGCRKLA
jgi:hypothetical protein